MSKKEAQRAPSTHSMSAYNPSTVDTIVEMFADNTAGESYGQNRLITEELSNGNVALVGYGWMKLAEYDETENMVTVFFGHKSVNSRTVSRWLNTVLEQCAERREVTVSDASPVVRQPNDCTDYIGHYVNFENRSPVEEDIVDEVVDSLRFLNRFL